MVRVPRTKCAAPALSSCVAACCMGLGRRRHLIAVHMCELAMRTPYTYKSHRDGQNIITYIRRLSVLPVTQSISTEERKGEWDGMEGRGGVGENKRVERTPTSREVMTGNERAKQNRFFIQVSTRTHLPLLCKVSRSTNSSLYLYIRPTLQLGQRVSIGIGN